MTDLLDGVAHFFYHIVSLFLGHSVDGLLPQTSSSNYKVCKADDHSNQMWIFPVPEDFTVVFGICCTLGIKKKQVGIRTYLQFLF